MHRLTSITLLCAVTLINGIQFDIGPNYSVIGMYPVNFALYPPGSEIWQIGNPLDDNHGIFWQAVANLAYRGGGVLQIEEGTYNIGWQLNYDGMSKVHINGAGKGKTVLRLMDAAIPFIVGTNKKSGFVRTRFSNDFIISNLTLDGNKLNQINDYEHNYGRFGIYIEGCDRVLIDSVTAVFFQGYGFHIHGDKKGGIWNTNTIISNCFATDNNLDGFIFDRMGATKVVNNVAFGNARHGFNIVSGSRGLELSGNTAKNNGYLYPTSSGCGFMVKNDLVYTTKDIVLADNVGYRNKKGAVCLSGEVTGVVINKTTVDDHCTCFHFNQGSSAVVEGSNCKAKVLYININNVVIKESEGGVPQALSVYMRSNNVFNAVTTCTKTQLVPLYDDIEGVEEEDDDYTVYVVPSSAGLAATPSGILLQCLAALSFAIGCA
jgi:parallel beta-helix repeat protein